jgi:hypothetical protein
MSVLPGADAHRTGASSLIRGLEALQQVEANFQNKRFLLRSQLTSEASAALRACWSRGATQVARVALTGHPGGNAVPKRFGTFISLCFLDAYVFLLSKGRFERIYALWTGAPPRRRPGTDASHNGPKTSVKEFNPANDLFSRAVA